MALRDCTGVNNTAVGHQSGILITSGSKNTILGTYDGNENNLDIRTSSNNIVLSDGDGQARAVFNDTRNSWSFTSSINAIGRLEAREEITVADGATLTLADAECGACLIHVYDNASGDGAVFFATYTGTTTLIHGDPSANFATSDVAGDLCVYKTAGSHTVTFKNNRGDSRPMSFMIVGSQSAKN